MRRFLAVSLLVFGFTSPMAMQSVQEPEAYPGQHSHMRPPEGFFCSPKAKDKAHACHCKRMSTPSADDPVCEFQDPKEDPRCTVFCYRDRCLCPVLCEKDGHNHSAVSSPSR